MSDRLGSCVAFIETDRQLVTGLQPGSLGVASCPGSAQHILQYMFHFFILIVIGVHVQRCEKPHQPIQLLSLIGKDHSQHVKNVSFFLLIFGLYIFI